MVVTEFISNFISKFTKFISNFTKFISPLYFFTKFISTLLGVLIKSEQVSQSSFIKNESRTNRQNVCVVKVYSKPLNQVTIFEFQ